MKGGGAVIGMWLSALALAQEPELPEVQAQLFRATPATQGWSWADDASRTHAQTARTVLHWTHRPLTIIRRYRDGREDEIRVVRGVLMLDTAAAVQVGPVRIAASLPVIAATTSDLYDTRGGLGDLGASLRWSTRVGAADTAPDVGAVVGVVLPTGSASSSLASTGAAVDLLAVASGDVHRVGWVVNAGYRFQPEAGLDALHYGDQVLYRLGLLAHLTPTVDGRVELAGQVNTAANDGPTLGASTPLEALGTGGIQVTDAVFVDAGLGVGLTTGLGTAGYRLMAGLRWAPTTP